jgi:hypothetical protein
MAHNVERNGGSAVSDPPPRHHRMSRPMQRDEPQRDPAKGLKK